MAMSDETVAKFRDAYIDVTGSTMWPTDDQFRRIIEATRLRTLTQPAEAEGLEVVAKLREWRVESDPLARSHTVQMLCDRAADTITALQAEVERLQKQIAEMEYSDGEVHRRTVRHHHRADAPGGCPEA